MIIDTSLDTLMLPALPTYQNEFGTKRLNGGLTTAECTDGVMIWGRRQRPFPVTETSETTKVEAHCTFEVTTAGIELTIADATFAGCEAKVINASDGTITVKGGVSGLNGSSDAVTIPPRAMLFLTFFEGWITSNSTYSGNNEVSDFEKRIFLASHPVTTLYWSSNPTNPGTLFGGTWEQIKDKFILAAGDTYPNGATGGNATTTLTEANLPSHTHSFTPAGTVSAHNHGLDNHTHSFSGSGSHTHGVMARDWKVNTRNDCFPISSNKFEYAFGSAGVEVIEGGYKYITKGARSGIQLLQSSTVSISGTTGGASGNTTSVAPAFTGTAGTTGATGSGTAFSNMPPYAVKYCWERTA